MTSPTVAVIGSGFSGLVSAIHLKNRLNIHADIFESTKQVGGTWHYNTYPGCACDIPSHLYSFSFELNPDWSQKYSNQKEIHDYMINVAKKHDLYPYIQLETEVTRATWLEDKKQWELELKTAGSNETRLAYYDMVFSGVGAIRVPNVPKEFQSFEGKIIHSAYWDNDYDLTNKKVAIIGNGTSSVQIIPVLQKKVAHLYSYQRTPTWITPRNQFYYPRLVKFVFKWVPFFMYLYRVYLFAIRELRFKAFSDVNSFIAKVFRSTLEKKMKQVLLSKGRADLIPKLIPTITPGCKRVGVSDDYLQALCEKNASVITSPIKEIVGRTIKTADGEEIEVDVLCLATGFNVNGFLGNMQVYGRDSVHLNKLWDENPAETYKTVNIHGFPNFFMLLGPGSGLGHNSVVSMIEIQVDYAIKLIKNMQRNKIQCIDPKLKPQAKFSNELQDSFKGTTWTSGCQSWYLGKNGGIQFLWSKTVTSFYFTLKNIHMEDFVKN